MNFPIDRKRCLRFVLYVLLASVNSIKMNHYKIRFTHRGENYVALKRKGETEKDAVDSIIEQCRIADLAKGKIIKPKISSVTPL